MSKLTYHHVSISNGFNFIDIIAAYDAIEHCVEIIQKVHHLQRCALRRHCSKTNNVAKIYGYLVEVNR